MVRNRRGSSGTGGADQEQDNLQQDMTRNSRSRDEDEDDLVGSRRILSGR